MSEREELAETLAPDVYEAYRLGKASRQEHLDDWYSRADDGPLPGVEIMRAADAVLASSWLRAHDDRIRAEALREAAESLPALTEGPLRVGTSLWPECDRDAYSLAIEEAQAALRAAAGTPTHDTTEEDA